MASTKRKILAENDQLQRELAAVRTRLEQAEDTIRCLREREAQPGRQDPAHERMSEALRAGEQKLQRLFRVVPALVAVHEGPEHVYCFTNAMHDRLLGRRKVHGLPLREAVPELAGQGILERYDHVYAAGEALVTPELKVMLGRHGDGVLEELYFSQVLQPWLDARGQVAGVMAFGFDVTEQVRAREAAKQSQERLRLALEAGRMGTWNMDVRTGELTWDAGTCRIFQVGPDDEIDYRRFLSELVHPDDRAMIESAVARAMDPAGNGQYSAEYRIVWPDGSVHWVLGTGQVLFAGAGPERAPARMLGTIMDVTDRREMERALRESEERFRTLADNMAQLTWMADSAGAASWYNERWYEYTGTTPAEMHGELCWSLLHPDQRERVRASYRRSLERGTIWEETFLLRGKDGAYRWFLSRAIPIRDRDGKVLRWFGTSTDVTAQREVEEALKEADRRKDEFLAMLAHELRNPLAPIRTALAVMSLAGTDADRVEHMRDMIERQVAHMSRLIDDLLDVSRIARGKVRLRMERCDLAAIARNVSEDYRPVLTASGLTLAVDLPAGPLWVQGDATRLAQVIGNLLSNANKFSAPGGHVAVSVAADAVARRALVTVRDTGMGIEPAMLEHVFEPFVQADLGLDRSKGGLGLGLALVRGLVALHGGTVAAQSDGIGRGARFALRLPLMPDEAPAGAGPAGSAPKRAGALRVLIVEDNRDTADSLRELLALLGHEVAVAYDGPAALEIAPGFRPDVVLCDIGLPGLDGFDVARALRQEPATRDAYLVAQTGYGQDEDRRRTREAGFDEHLRKPVALAELQRILAMVASR